MHITATVSSLQTFNWVTMQNQDWYAVLGILPDAEEVVVRAAYRALAQRYHPDRCTDQTADSTRRMAEINMAFAVIGNSASRAEYDKERSGSKQATFSADDDERFDAFDAAIKEVEERWRIAADVFPQIQADRLRLSQVSRSLSFAYVTTLLTTKSFANGSTIANQMEGVFLERFFGENRQIVEFAKTLIFENHREAARGLNRLVEILGSEVDPDLIISRIESQYGLVNLRQRKAAELQQIARIDALKNQVRRFGEFYDAKILAELLGFTIESKDRGFLRGYTVFVHRDGQTVLELSSQDAFKSWAKKNLCD